MTTATPAAPVTLSSPRPTGPSPSRATRARKWLLAPKTLIVAGVAGIIGYLALVPLYYLLYGTFFDANGFTFGGFSRAYSANGIGELITNSLIFAFGSAALSLVVGTSLAYLNVRTDVPFKPLFFAASMIPLIIPGILYTVS